MTGEEDAVVAGPSWYPQHFVRSRGDQNAGGFRWSLMSVPFNFFSIQGSPKRGGSEGTIRSKSRAAMPPCQPLEREGKREVTAWLTTGVAAESKTGGGGGSLAGWLPWQRLRGLV